MACHQSGQWLVTMVDNDLPRVNSSARPFKPSMGWPYSPISSPSQRCTLTKQLSICPGHCYMVTVSGIYRQRHYHLPEANHGLYLSGSRLRPLSLTPCWPASSLSLRMASRVLTSLCDPVLYTCHTAPKMLSKMEKK